MVAVSAATGGAAAVPGWVLDMSGPHCPLNAPCQRCQLESVEAERDDLRAEVERRDALIRSDGYEDMRQHAEDLAQQLDAARAAAARLREKLERVLCAVALAADALVDGPDEVGDGRR